MLALAHLTIPIPVVIAALFVCCACVSAPERIAASVDSHATHGIPNGHLLLIPVGDPENLLGRSVTKRSSGEWHVSENRAAGCHVRQRRTDELWTRTILEEVEDLIDLSAGAAALGEVRARYGSKAHSRMSISNHAVVRADLNGPCGEWVIDSVKIGIGSRDFLEREDYGAGVHVGVANAGLGAGSLRHAEGRLQWTVPQGWAFTVSKRDDSRRLALEIEMPTRMTDGTTYTPLVTSPKDVFLIVLSQELGGRTAILLPNAKVPYLAVTRGEPRPLPLMQALVPLGATEPTYEKLVVYAFTEREDYNDYRPPIGRLTFDEMKEYAERLPERLEAVPQARWSVTHVRYEVHPVQPIAAASGGSRPTETSSHRTEGEQ